MAKGSSNERDKCRDWSSWWSKGIGAHPVRNDIFWRTAGSGARARTRTKGGQSVLRGYGDMMAEDPCGQPLIDWCTFEFKKGYTKDLSLLGVLDSRQQKPKMVQFLLEVELDAEDANNFPVLVIHRDRRLPVIALPVNLFGQLVEFCGSPTAIISGNLLTLETPYLLYRYQFLVLSEFFEWASPTFFLQPYR